MSFSREETFYNLLVKRYEINRKRGYQKFYIVIDLHDTIMTGSKSANESLEFVSDICKLTLQGLSKIEDIVLIIWTSTWPEKWSKIVKPWLEQNQIFFKYFNENPECKSNSYSYFSYKFYFDIGIDDKFGFDVYDWNQVFDFMKYLENRKVENGIDS